MFKLMTLISNIINAGHSSSFLSATFILTWIKNLWSKCLNFLLQILWTVCKLVFGVMEAFEYMIKKFLGIGATIYDVAEFGEGVILNSGPYSGLSYVDFLFDIFRAILAAAIILLIVFTIIAIIKQEWQTANEGFEGKKNKSPNDKTGIIMRSFRGILAMFALPLTMMLIIGGFNAILTSFNNAIAYESDVTIAGQVLATSTYDANKYRTYANANQRVPIVITAYNSKDIKPDELTAMSYKIKDVDIQNKLKKTATNLVNNENLTFKESLVYKNNKF